MKMQSSEALPARFMALELENRQLRETLLAALTALGASRAETKAGASELLASETALASSQVNLQTGVSELLAAATALAASRAETKIGAADLLVSQLALASSQAELKIGLSDLLAAVTALVASRAETKTGAADLLASQTALGVLQAEMKIAVSNLIEAVAELAVSRAESKIGAPDLLVGEAAFVVSEGEEKIGVSDLLAAITGLEADLLAAEKLNEFLSQGLTEARNRAEEANRAKSRFLAGVSHELRTPLNGIMGYAHLLHMDGGLNVTQAARVNAMLECGKHLLEMIACVLDLSEIEADHVTLRPMEINPKAIAEACLDLVRPIAEKKGLALSLAMTPDTPHEVTADPTRLRQVLLNLLGNAIKFTRHGGVRVQLKALADRAIIRFEVEDTGPGVPIKQQQRLFQEFARLDSEATSEAEGAGLGLALSSRLAILMGGRLGHSDNPSGGSVFWLELPEANVASSLDFTTPAPEPRGAPTAQPSRLFKVLIVDDVAMNLDIAGSFMRAGGHNVTCVGSGAEAVAAAEEIDFDVILMDVRMPEMDGLEATRRIRALQGRRARVPIVALTAQAFTDQVAECRKAGMGHHLAKPFDPDALLTVVVQAIDAGL